MAQIDIADLEIKGMRLDLVDLISPHVPAFKECVPYLNMYGSELEALVKLPDAERRKELIAIAHKVLTSYKRDKDGGRKDV
ncbi:MAG: hypothetical protein ACI4AQ_05790 [Lachnospiraceae bacterium]